MKKTNYNNNGNNNEESSCANFEEEVNNNEKQLESNILDNIQYLQKEYISKKERHVFLKSEMKK